MAAEDATTVPLLPTAIFHLVGATSLGPDAAHSAAMTLATCAAQLAAAPRDPACTSVQVWRPDDGEKLRLIGLLGASQMLGRQRIFDQGWSALDCAQFIMIDCAARIVGRRPGSDLECAWLFALERAMRARLAAGGACVPPSAPAMSMAPMAGSLQADGTLLPEAQHFYFSADFHNSQRFERLFASLKDVAGLDKKKQLQTAMKQQALGNLRDQGVVHRLTVATAPTPVNTHLEERWEAEARALWVAQAAPSKKRARGGAGSAAAEDGAGGKQQKLSFGV